MKPNESYEGCVTNRGQVRHELKTWPQEFTSVVNGSLRHEVRKNDRCFRVGDELLLREWNPLTGTYTGNTVLVRVTYLTTGEELFHQYDQGSGQFPDDLVVMSVKVENWLFQKRKGCEL